MSIPHLCVSLTHRQPSKVSVLSRRVAGWKRVVGSILRCIAKVICSLYWIPVCRTFVTRCLSPGLQGGQYASEHTRSRGEPQHRLAELIGLAGDKASVARTCPCNLSVSNDVSLPSSARTNYTPGRGVRAEDSRRKGFARSLNLHSPRTRGSQSG